MTFEYPHDVGIMHGNIIRAAREVADKIGGKELAQITEATGSTEISATIVRLKARIQELDARNAVEVKP